MNKWRIKFSKLGMGKYISHLDLLRAFTRSIIRANLPVKYSEGFNPHQIISFALPLAIGITSEIEFVDVTFVEDIDPIEVLELLNLKLPNDIRIVEIFIPCFNAKEIFAAEYIINITSSEIIRYEKVEELFGKDILIVSKKSKRGEKDVNIFDYIHKVDIIEQETYFFTLKVILSAGNEDNLKPDLLVSVIEKEVLNQEAESVDVHRTQVFCKKNDKIELFS